MSYAGLLFGILLGNVARSDCVEEFIGNRRLDSSHVNICVSGTFHGHFAHHQSDRPELNIGIDEIRITTRQFLCMARRILPRRARRHGEFKKTTTSAKSANSSQDDFRKVNESHTDNSTGSVGHKKSRETTKNRVVFAFEVSCSFVFFVPQEIQMWLRLRRDVHFVVSWFKSFVSIRVIRGQFGSG